MKKSITLLTIAFISFLNSSFNRNSAAPKLYPELDNFFKSVKPLPISDAHREVLNNTCSFFISSALGNKEGDVVYSCPDNSFRSIAAQIFTQTFMGVYKYKKVKVFSCGNDKGSISSDLIPLLTNAGYKVSVKDNGIIEVKYSDDLSPLLISTTKADETTLPKSGFLYVTLCSTDESCPALNGSAFKYSLDFANPKSGGDPATEFKQIAAEIYYASTKAYDSYH